MIANKEPPKLSRSDNLRDNGIECRQLQPNKDSLGQPLVVGLVEKYTGDCTGERGQRVIGLVVRNDWNLEG